MTLQVLNFIVYTQTALSLGVAIYSIVKWKQKETYIKLVGLLFFAGFLSNTISQSLYLSGYGKLVNIPNSVYDLVSFCLLILIYYYALNKKYGGFFFFICLFFLVMATMNLFFIQKSLINSNIMFLRAIIIICLCVFYFYRLMVELPVTYLHRMPMFWINSAFLIYNAGALFLFAFTSYITTVLKDNLVLYWSFHNILSIIEHLVVLIGLTYALTNSRKLRPDTERKTSPF